MKMHQMLAAGLVAAGTLTVNAQAIPTPVAPVVPAPAPVQVAAAVAAAGDYEPGALCKLYNLPVGRNGSVNVGANEMTKALRGAVPARQGFDPKSTAFTGEAVAGGAVYNCAVWEGGFWAKKAGEYDITLSAGLYACGIEICGKSIFAFRSEPQTIRVTLNEGFNPVKIAKMHAANDDRGWMKIEYRFATSTKSPKVMTPASLVHVAVDEEDDW